MTQFQTWPRFYWDNLGKFYEDPKKNKQSPKFMSPALFLFELLKVSKLTRGPLVLYHLPK